eukprot:jgi/Chrzof1/6139/Cz17g12090.t1
MRLTVQRSEASVLLVQSCGLVVEAHIIDERSEWRTFGDKEKDSDDPSRVGAAANALYADGGLSTSIGKVQGDGGASYSLNRLQNRQNLTDRVLQNAVRQIGIACERLSVVDGVKHRASEVFKKVGWLVHVYV